jgi:hypothetical protein
MQNPAEPSERHGQWAEFYVRMLDIHPLKKELKHFTHCRSGGARAPGHSASNHSPFPVSSGHGTGSLLLRCGGLNNIVGT